jgi:hypothetical protein
METRIALWVTVNKHFSHGLQFLSSATFSKSLDYNSLSTGETYIIQNAYNPVEMVVEFDVRHRLFLAASTSCRSKQTACGWMKSHCVQAQSAVL